ncbi:MAG: hypothetical protein Q8O55_03635 [Dehalococcoidales bacterium]|nr:hypothetical protein [Dehalococcoidales bacterium]
MRFVHGYVADVDEAVALVLREAGRVDMTQEAADLFLTSIDTTKLRTDAEKAVDTEVRRRYGRNARWQGELYFVPLPRLRYEALPVPLLMFNLQPYLVAGLAILNTDHSPYINLAGPIGKPEKLILPLEFLQTMLDETLDSFHIVAKDGTRTNWKVPFLQEPLRLPDGFLHDLSCELERKSVLSWLLGYGDNGRGVMPQVVGSLLGLQFRTVPTTSLSDKQLWSQDDVLETLIRMFGAQKARTLLNTALPHLKADMTNEEAIRLIIQMAGKES